MEPEHDSTGSGWYLPHRAIILVGASIIAVALIGASLGVVNSARAEQATRTLSDRYLVVLSPVRQIRASGTDFQLIVERALTGTTPIGEFLTSAVADSNATDRSYLALERVLALPGNSTLAPTLSAQMATYVAARVKLASFLAATATPGQNIQIASTERAAYEKLDGTLATLQTLVTNRSTLTAHQAEGAANASRIALLWSVVGGVLLAVAVTALFATKAYRVEEESNRRDTAQARLTRRSEFEAQLQRALEMSKAEPSVFELVTEALGGAAPGMYAELLMADSSRAHFRQVLVSPVDDDDQGCAVVSPDDCPAAARGQTMAFPSSTAIDACPHLRGRGCSAICVPVSISGNSVGVFHVTSTDGVPPSGAVRDDVEVVARRASERLAMLRAFELSQTQANSDSLTGLLTRRSLEHGVRELQEKGVPYTVAYGDLDHFKQLNDVFGHDAGDRALRSFSQVLRDSLRPADIPCRYGGEEFVIVLPSCPIREAEQVLERVRERIAQRVATGGTPEFTVSFGLASSEQAADFQDVVGLADEALLHAKQTGRDRIVVADSLPSGPSVPVVVGQEGRPAVVGLLPVVEPIDRTRGRDSVVAGPVAP